MNGKLLDTNIIIRFINGDDSLNNIFEEDNLFFSSITLGELFYGAECSSNPERNRLEIDSFIADIEVLPFSLCIKEFCKQKARLRSMGMLIEDFDLFIGSMAIATGYTLVTENIKHLSRLQGIMIENWVER